jgi:hypothetical protein
MLQLIRVLLNLWDFLQLEHFSHRSTATLQPFIHSLLISLENARNGMKTVEKEHGMKQ